MFLARSGVLAGGIALSLLFAGGCAPAGWSNPAEAEELDDRLTVSGDIFDRPGSDNPCRGREITITPGRDGDTTREAEIARGLIVQCRPTLTYEELLYRYTRAAAERDDARRQLQALATMPPPQIVTQPVVEPYPAYSSGSAHPAAPVIYEQDMYQPPVAAPIAPIIVQPTPVYVSPPPAIIVAPRPPHHRPPPHYVTPAPPPVVHRPPPQPRPPAYTPPIIHNPPSPPPVVHRPPPAPTIPVVQPPPVVHRPPPVVHQPPPVVHQPSPPPTVYRPPPPPPPAGTPRPPAGSVGQPGQDRSTYGK